MPDLVYLIEGLLAGLLIGAAVGWLWASRRANLAEGMAAGLEGTVAELREQNRRAAGDFDKLRLTLADERSAKDKAETRLAEIERRLEEERKLLDEARAKLTDTFKALAGDALKQSNASFLELANKTLEKALAEAKGDLGQRHEAIQGQIKPLADLVKQYDERVQGLGKEVQGLYSGLTAELKNVSANNEKLQRETGALVTALRKPQVRGRWGEMTLRRVVELAGMSEHCDFTEQPVTGSGQRPDLTVHLPSGRTIVVDAKAPLEAYLEAIEATSEEQRKAAMGRHAAQVRSHMSALADKRYWENVGSPEFVVMFIPGESFFSAAVDEDQSLIENGLDKGVVLATPTTLIALIRAVAFGWRQEHIAQSAREISEQGKILFDRMKILGNHIVEIGDGLTKASVAYNKSIGSMQDRVFPAARKLKELGATSGDDFPEVPPVEITLRDLPPNLRDE